MRAKVFLATPCYGGILTQTYFHSVQALLIRAMAGGFGLIVETLAGDSLIPRARNTLVAKFLAQAEATHLLFVDADIGFAPETIEGMLAFRQDVVACAYPLKQMVWDAGAVARARAGELVTTAPLRYVGTPEPGAETRRRGAYLPAEYAGTGLMMIRREAIERMIEAYPELKIEAAHATLDAPAPYLHALFDTGVDPATRHYLSEDYVFCARWRALGGTIWLDTESVLTHAGSYVFAGNPSLRYPVRAEAA